MLEKDLNDFENFITESLGMDQCGRELNEHLTAGDIYGIARVFTKLLAVIRYHGPPDSTGRSQIKTDKDNVRR